MIKEENPFLEMLVNIGKLKGSFLKLDWFQFLSPNNILFIVLQIHLPNRKHITIFSVIASETTKPYVLKLTYRRTK
jgi:hypothetical protein